MFVPNLCFASPFFFHSNDAARAEEEKAKTRHSSLSFMKEILPSYFSSEWSFASFHIQECHSLVCFGADSASVIGEQRRSFLSAYYPFFASCRIVGCVTLV